MQGGTIALLSCVLIDNRGGGLFVDKGAVRIANSRFERNGHTVHAGSLSIATAFSSTNLGGGAIRAIGGARLVIDSCIFFNNSASEGGAILIEGEDSAMHISRSLLGQNRASIRGGGLEVRGGAVTLSNGTQLRGNSAPVAKTYTVWS